MIFSSIVHTTEVTETSLLFSVDILLPFLRIATILAVLHNEGVVPVVSDVVNIFVKIRAISSAHSLRIYVDILSGPFAFLGSRIFSNFCTPLTYNV